MVVDSALPCDAVLALPPMPTSKLGLPVFAVVGIALKNVSSRETSFLKYDMSSKREKSRDPAPASDEDAEGDDAAA